MNGSSAWRSIAYGDGKVRSWPVSNHLLARVAPDEQPKLAGYLEEVSLELGQILYEPGDRLEHVYFPTSGMISLVVVTNDGGRAETAAIGPEGAAAVSASGFVDNAFTCFMVQIPGAAQRVRAEDFEEMVDSSRLLKKSFGLGDKA